MSDQVTNEEVKKNPAPVLRSISRGESGWQENLVLWASKEGGKSAFNGFTNVGGHASVVGFINMNTEKNVPFISLSKRVTNAETGEDHLVRFATGNPLNSRKDNEPVFFDTVLFNTIDGQTINARITKTMSEELHQAIGFTNAPIERPKAEKSEETQTPATERQRG